MIRTKRFLASVAVVAIVASGLSGCASMKNMNLPGFMQGKDKNKSKASAGERVSIVAFDQKVEASESLKSIQIFLPEAKPVADWPVPGGNAEQSLENIDAAPDLAIAWRTKFGAGSNGDKQVVAPPVAAAGKVFVMDGGAIVSAIDAKTGKTVWRQDLDPKEKKDKEGFGGGLAVVGDKIFVTSGYRFVAALDAASGKVLWRTRTTVAVHSAPAVDGTRVYAVDIDNQLLAFNQEDGTQAWTQQAIVEPARLLKASTPALSGDLVVTPFSSGEVMAVRSNNGQVVWTEVLSRTSRTNALSEIRDVAGRPAVYRGEVFAASHSGILAALDLKTGTHHWEVPLASTSGVWPTGDAVYAVSVTGELVALNRDSGQAYWVKDLNEGRKAKKVGGFMGLGKHEVKPIWTGPMVVRDRLIVINNEGELQALDAKTGKVQKTVKLGAPGYIAPIAMDGHLYVVTNDAQLIAIR